MPDTLLQRAIDTASAAPRGILVVGAGGGIGHAFAERCSEHFPAATIVRLARAPQRLKSLRSTTIDIACDIGEAPQIAEAVDAIPDARQIDWVFIATGWLHDAQRSPEKTFRSLDAEHLLYAYRINAVGPALLLKQLLPRLGQERACTIGILSARVGSISDNRIGGWHAYRASKAALNMLIRNFAIELRRNRSPHRVVGLQPGTTDTALSAPFRRNVPAQQMQTPRYTAEQLLQVMRRLRSEDSGGLFDFLGLPFEP